MGLFKRKDSKNSIQSEKEDFDSTVTVNSARTSNASLRSPGYKGSGLPASIPELPIAKPPDPALDPAAYLRSIHAVRERCSLVLNKAKRNRLNHFDVDMGKFMATASYIVSIIKVHTTCCSPLGQKFSQSLYSLSGLLIRAFVCREIMARTTTPFLLMAVGNTSTWVDDPALTNCSSPGPVPLMRRSAPGD